MYFDVVRTNEGRVLFNSTPKAVYAWLVERRDSAVLDDTHVIPGHNLKTYTVSEYLAITQA